MQVEQVRGNIMEDQVVLEMEPAIEEENVEQIEEDEVIEEQIQQQVEESLGPFLKKIDMMIIYEFLWIFFFESSFDNAHTCATILDDADVGGDGSSTSEVIDVNSEREDMDM
ncbi:hypothetical protein K7X08_000763 [Anisodus acutangulus]|uniref:Uncharacterized protein n=1 Tax=Anisodus acutangulus TaxID=402998 RepID=A0A9Q1RB83_9SOLA|nr:hypothetical protein K7X08_000763 [Anisodus acutangulus]